jgi:hypothetical protein
VAATVARDALQRLSRRRRVERFFTYENLAIWQNSSKTSVASIASPAPIAERFVMGGLRRWPNVVYVVYFVN